MEYSTVFIRDGIKVFCNNSCRNILYREITKIISDGAYRTIELMNGKEVYVKETLDFFALNLPLAFIRVHRSSIINLLHIKEYYSDKKRIRVIMHNNTIIQVARSKKMFFLNRFHEMDQISYPGSDCITCKFFYLFSKQEPFYFSKE